MTHHPPTINIVPTSQPVEEFAVPTDVRFLVDNAEALDKYLDLNGLATLLGHCIINQNYKVPDELAAAIQLSPLGLVINEAIRRSNPRVRADELRLALFLQVGCPAGLLISIDSDYEAMRSAIAGQIKKRKLLFPYIFGRELHDEIAKQYPEHPSLDNQQAVRVLESTPIGVFQVGRTVTGPYGCLVSDQRRGLRPKRAVVGFLCRDATCARIHRIWLATAETAPIMRARKAVGRYISETYSRDDAQNQSLINEAVSARTDGYHPAYSPDGLLDTLADGLSESELRRVVDVLLRSALDQPGKRSDLSKQTGSVVGNPTAFVEPLARPALLQLALCFSDRALMAAVDRAVATGDVPIEEFERRVEKIRRWGLGPRAEIGTRGLRYSARASDNYVARHLLALLNRLYCESDLLDIGDLAFLLGLGGSSKLSLSELFSKAVGELTPDRVLRELVMVNRRAAMGALNFLGVFAPDDSPREDLLERLLWKLGVSVQIVFGDLDRVRRHADVLAGSLNQSEEQDVLRGHMSNLFADFETSLQRSLEFSAFALLNDHFLSRRGFEYDPLAGAQMALVDQMAPASEARLKLVPGNNTIVPLASGFSRLARALREARTADHARARLELPRETRVTGRPFVFASRLPFFNCTPSGQAAIVRDLSAIGELAQDPALVIVRNAGIHGNTDFPRHEEIVVALARVKACCDVLHASGLYPRAFNLVERLRDVIGRERFRYRSDPDTVELFAPQWPLAPRLPMSSSQLLIIPGVAQGSAGPLRFRLKEQPGSDPYWDGWPKQWSLRSDFSPEVHSGSEQSDSEYATA